MSKFEITLFECPKYDDLEENASHNIARTSTYSKNIYQTNVLSQEDYGIVERIKALRLKEL